MPDALPRRMITTMRKHPVITAVMLGCMALGPVLGVLLLPEDWAMWRKILGGLVGGAGVGLMITAPRIVGPSGG